MTRRWCLGLVCVYVFVACQDDVLPKKETRPTSELPYPRFETDVATMRETVDLPGGDSAARASSARACSAARRVFHQVDFVGMHRTEVLAHLGDPGTISSSGVSAGTEHDSAFIYRLDSGLGGFEYVLVFERHVVVRFEERSLE